MDFEFRVVSASIDEDVWDSLGGIVEGRVDEEFRFDDVSIALEFSDDGHGHHGIESAGVSGHGDAGAGILELFESLDLDVDGKNANRAPEESPRPPSLQASIGQIVGVVVESEEVSNPQPEGDDQSCGLQHKKEGMLEETFLKMEISYLFQVQSLPLEMN